MATFTEYPFYRSGSFYLPGNINDTNDLASIWPTQRLLMDTGGGDSLDWENHKLENGASLRVDWGDSDNIKVYENLSVNSEGASSVIWIKGAAGSTLWLGNDAQTTNFTGVQFYGTNDGLYNWDLSVAGPYDYYENRISFNDNTNGTTPITIQGTGGEGNRGTVEIAADAGSPSNFGTPYNLRVNGTSSFTGEMHISTMTFDGYGSGFLKLVSDTVTLNSVPLAQIVAHADSTGQTATNNSVVTYTTPNDATQHSFRIGAYTAITAISAGTLTITATFTDENNTSRTVTFFGMGLTSAGLTATGFTAFPSVNIRCKENTAITLKSTFTGVSTTYDVGGTIESLY